MDNEFSKAVTVKNTGTSDQYVRVFLDFSDSSVRDRSKIVYTKDGVKREGEWSAFLADLPEGWTFVPDNDPTDGAILGGYFYYQTALEPNASTTPLITGIKTTYGTDFDPDQITDFDVIVYSESVQVVETASGAVYNSDTGWQSAWRSFLSRS